VEAIQDGRYTAERKAAWVAELRTVFNRGFWQGGYYCGEPLGEWSGRGHSQATRSRKQIGVVSNFYARPQVAEFELWQPLLRSGDELLIEGPTTGSVRLTAENIQADGQPVEAAHRGAKVTLHTPVKVRRQDKVFLHNLKEEEN
jgi:putative protease